MLTFHAELLKGEIYEYLHRELEEHQRKLDDETRVELDGDLWRIAGKLADSLCPRFTTKVAAEIAEDFIRRNSKGILCAIGNSSRGEVLTALAKRLISRTSSETR